MQQSEDVLLYHEADEEFTLHLTKAESQEHIFVVSGSKTTQFVLHLLVNDPFQELKPLTPHIPGTDFIVSHRAGHFFIQRRNDEVYNSELLVCPVGSIDNTTLLLPHRPRYC